MTRWFPLLGRSQEADVHVHVAGNDVPGTLVTLQLRRDGQLIPPVTLRRASTLDLADRKRMFALFTEAKGLALKENAGACRRLCLWSINRRLALTDSGRL